MQLEEEKLIKDIDVELKLSILKPLHGKWINELYGYVTSEEGCRIIPNGWKAAYITDDIEQGTKGLEPLDPFFDIDPKINKDNHTIEETLARQDDIDFFTMQFVNHDSDNEDECEFEGIP